MAHLDNLKDYGLHHVGFFVDDREKYMKIMEDRFGITEWQVYSYSPSEATLYGEKCEEPFSIHIAMGMTKDKECRLELIQPGDGVSYHSKWVEKNGIGMSHICFCVEDYDYWKQFYLDQGLELVVECLAEDDVIGKRRALYFEDHVLGCVMELCETTPTRM